MSNRDDPYFTIQPVKVEEAHTNPDLLIFHDVISQSDRKLVKQIAAPLVSIANIRTSISIM